ncbi:MAG: hypothetical protein DLM68_10535 [Hyphomicrobiales bacterium]|nr:MAG: hypothetical protein DLM68_10535 [Hyphomicrobiales bacterium]
MTRETGQTKTRLLDYGSPLLSTASAASFSATESVTRAAGSRQIGKLIVSHEVASCTGPHAFALCLAKPVAQHGLPC